MIHRLRDCLRHIEGALALATMVFWCGCASSPAPDLTTHYDHVSGLRTDLLSDNLLPTGEDPHELIWLNASRLFQSGSRYMYYLEITYMAREESGLLGIAPGRSLTLSVDEENIELTGSGSSGEASQGEKGLVQETAIYRVNKLTLQKISIAKKVKVAVRGSKGLVEREFEEENFDKFRRFVTRYAL